MNTLYSTANGIADRLATGEVVWEWICKIDPPPNGNSWDAAWMVRTEARYTEIMEETDLLHLPSELMDRLDEMIDERKVWRHKPADYEPDMPSPWEMDRLAMESENRYARF